MKIDYYLNGVHWHGHHWPRTRRTPNDVSGQVNMGTPFSGDLFFYFAGPGIGVISIQICNGKPLCNNARRSLGPKVC